jgi:dTMP kinase
MPLITFEGGDGSGKTTQIALVAEILRAQKLDVLTTLEPGGTELGLLIRSIFLNPNLALTNTTEILLMMAARSQHCEQVIYPALLDGVVILCDRFTDSTKAFQGYGYDVIDNVSGQRLQQIDTLNKIATKGIVPALTIWLDIDPQTAIDRVARRGNKDRIESKSINYHQWVRIGYQQMAAAEPKRFVRIDAKLEPELVTAQIVDSISKFLNYQI